MVSKNITKAPAEIQAILFEKDKWTTAGARGWLKRHEHKPIKRVDVTENLFRYRLTEPEEGATYRIKKTKEGILFVLKLKKRKPKKEKLEKNNLI